MRNNILLYCCFLFLSCDSQQNGKKTNPNVDSATLSNSPPKAVIVNAPQSVSVKIDSKDSTYLSIILTKVDYHISLLKDSLHTTEIGKIDNFISVHIKQLNKEKILVSNNSNSKYESFKKLKDILKKYGLYKFRIVTTAD